MARPNFEVAKTRDWCKRGVFLLSPFSFPSASRKPQLKAIVSGKSEVASNKERVVTAYYQNNGILS